MAGITCKNGKLSMLGLTLLLCFFTTGCFDRQELEQQAFVTALGIDKAPGGLIDCTFRIALPKSQSGGGAGGGGGGGGKTPLAGTGPLTYRAHTVTEAILLANSSVERTMTLSHLNSVLFGEEMAHEGLSKVLEPMVRFREFRRTVFLRVCKGKARDVMMKNTPVLESSQYKMAEDINAVGKKTGLIPVDTQLHGFTTAVENGHEAPVLPVFAVNQSVEKDPKGEQGPQDGVTYQAGQVRRAGGNPVEWSGSAVFKGDKLVGFFNGREDIYLRMLRSTITRTLMDFPDPKKPGTYLGLSVRNARKPTYRTVLGNPVRVTISVPLEADLVNSDSGIDYTQTANRMALERYLNSVMSDEMEQVMRKMFHIYDVDAIPVSRHIRSQFLTHDEFQNYPWEERIKTADVTVRCDIHIRRFGVQMIPIKANA